MSAIGTGVAAGVAQTALAAQQTARQRDKIKSQTAGDAERLKEQIETHMRALEEGDESETPAQLRIDGHVPEQQAGQQRPQQSRHEPTDQAQLASDQTDPATPAKPKAPTTDGQLYQHLDVQA